MESEEDGQLCSIDLSKKHSLDLYKGLEKFREAGTLLGKYHVAKIGRGPANASQRCVRQPRVAAIRQWCAEQNITISARGRIPESVVAQYDAAHAT
jgi:hypothetical protein